MSKNLYALSITGFTAAGIIFAALMSRISLHWTWPVHSQWWFLGFALGVLAVSLIGALIVNASDHPMVSLFGYTLISGPFGLLLGPVVAQYTAASVMHVFVLTSLIVIVLGVVGVVIPESLESWGIWLMGGLLVLIVSFFAVPIAAALGFHHVGSMLVAWNWLGLVIFAGLTIFDLNRAMRLPRTLDNAIDCSAAVFLDFINIFIRLLALMGQSNSSSSKS